VQSNIPHQTDLPVSTQGAPSLALLQSIIDELPGIIYLVRGWDARIVLANNAARGTLGAHWQPDQSLLDVLAAAQVQISSEEGRPLPLASPAIMQSIQQRKKITPRLVHVQRPGGASRVLLAHALALDPAPLAQLQTGEKAAERIAPEEREPWALIVLEDRSLHQEAEQLKQVVQALKEAEVIKDDFIATAAHELRGPLTALVGYAEMLKEQQTGKGGAELAEWQMEALQIIAHDTMFIANLTSELLDVTRIQAGQLELHRYQANLVALVQRVAKRLRNATQSHELSVEAAAPRMYVSIDVQRIEQVVANLLSNAIKYSPEGGKIRVTIRSDQERGVAELAVQDQGIGIPESQHAGIFNRFFRAENALASGAEGAGLGLYLCKELVRLHHGRIWFESRAGQGSTFYVSLPLLAPGTFRESGPLGT
jgi:signal transduction histidine kinase